MQYLYECSIFETKIFPSFTFLFLHTFSRHGSLGPAGLPKNQEEAQEEKL
jgi:hypothetical protein